MSEMQKIIVFFMLVGVVIGWSACVRSLDAPIPVVNNGVRDSVGNIRTELAASSYTLFNRALLKVNVDSSFSFYTVFAPTDSAMTGAGFTAAAIDALPVDSLYKIVAYHLVYGVYDDSALQGDTITQRLPTLRIDVSEVPAYNSYTSVSTQQYLYLSGRGGLFVNGVPANGGLAALRASNGIIYPVDHVLKPDTGTVWSIIQSRPELSMYVAANEIVDSLYNAQGFYNETVDSTMFSMLSVPNSYYGAPPILLGFTVLAPTDDAFARAGFHTVDDIRQYASQFVAGSNYVNGVTVNNYNPMDSVLKAHYLYHQGQNILFYQDLLYSPVINDGWLNSNDWWLTAYQAATQAQLGITPYYPQFAGQGGVLSIQWSRDGATAPATLPFTAANSFVAANGVVYEIDQLFYPHN